MNRWQSCGCVMYVLYVVCRQEFEVARTMLDMRINRTCLPGSVLSSAPVKVLSFTDETRYRKRNCFLTASRGKWWTKIWNGWVLRWVEHPSKSEPVVAFGFAVWRCKTFQRMVTGPHPTLGDRDTGGESESVVCASRLVLLSCSSMIMKTWWRERERERERERDREMETGVAG